MNKYKELSKNIILFAISSFIPKILTFVLVPIYTAYLTTSEYGTADLINTTVSLMLPILTLNISNAVLRFSLDDNYSKKNCFSVAIKILVFDVLILLIFTLLQIRFNIIKTDTTNVIFFDLLVIFLGIYDIFNVFCKGLNKINLIVISSFVNVTLTLILNIVFLIIFKMGLFGFLLANLLGYVVADFIYLFLGKLYKYISFDISRNCTHEMIKYSFPIIFSTIAWWINNASDRYIISFIVGVSASGIYATSAKIPSILTTFQSIFMQAWSISAIKEFDKNDADGFIGSMYSIICCGSCILCSILMIFNLLISKILFSNDFYVAWTYVPPLLLSVTIDSLSVFLAHLFFAVKDTKSRAFATIIGAIINTILNFILIRKIGVYGAAISTVIGYFCCFVFSRLLVKKYICMNTNMVKNDLALLLLFFQVFLAFYGNKYLIFQIIILGTIMLLFTKEIKHLLSTLRNILNKVMMKSK